ncbi:CvpA family protein [Odoribacter lunatus]|uniref:CvpA family protein n=1 Tax=Odoribacter lunatus TaxID=2941335 RepID=UPI00203FACB7|nr:CvpA family protein [Odoribacter lunatus]
MNLIDIILLLPLVYGAYKGFSKGLIVEIATLVGVILGVYIAIHYSDVTEVLLRDFLNITSGYLSYIALSITFLVVMVLIFVLGKMLTKIIDMVSLGLVNKLLGTILGIAKYFLILCVLLLLVDALDDKFHFMKNETKENSLLYHPFLTFARQMYDMIKS